MNKYIEAIKALDIETVKSMIEKDAKWLTWAEPSGKNALHYLCGLGPGDAKSSEASLAILKLLLKKGMNMNSIHRIEDKNCDFFPATPLWYAYTRGRNEMLYKFLLKSGADPSHCWWAIAWYDDVAAAKLWLKHGAKIDGKPSYDDLFVGSFAWKKLTFAKWTLDNGADVNAMGPDGNTALMIAIKRKDEDAIKLLVSLGADCSIENEKGMSAKKIAETNGPKRLLNLF